MKKTKIIIFLSAFVFVFILFVMSVNALSLDLSVKASEENMKQAEIAGKIEETIKLEGYPSYYGGVYVSEDSSHVVIQIVDNKIPISKRSKEYEKYNEILKISDNIKIEYVKYSQKELYDINDSLVKYFISDNADLSNLVAHYVDTFNNVVVVELKDNTIPHVNIFKEATNVEEILKKYSITTDIIVFNKRKEHKTEAIKVG